MKLRNLLFVVTLATAGLLGSSKTYAQAFQTGDIIVDGYDWYHSDGTFVGIVPSYGTCGGYTFTGYATPFDLQGNYYVDYAIQGNPNDTAAIWKLDASGNCVKNIVTLSWAALGVTQMVLDAKEDIYLMFTEYYGNQYVQEMQLFNQAGTSLNSWGYSGLGYGVTGDLSRDQKTMYLDGQNGAIVALNLKTRALKTLACGSGGYLRVLGDGSYLATDGFSNVLHCTSAGKLIHTYSIPPAVGDNLIGIGLDPDGQTFLVGSYVNHAVYRVDFSSGSVTTLISSTITPFSIEVYGMAEVGQCPLLPATFMVSFPLQAVGTTSSAKIDTLTDKGLVSVPIGSVAKSGANAGDFAMTENCSNTTLAAGKKCSISLTFTPSATGKRSATLTVPHTVSSAACSPLTISVKGTGY